MSNKRLHASLGTMLLFATACDPPPPAPIQSPAEPATQPAPTHGIRRPTTQALLEGPWKSVPISVLPLTIRVPESWELVTIGDSGLLAMEGFAPSGMLQLRCATRRRIGVDQLESFVAAARKNAESQPGKLKSIELREGPNYTILETLISADKPDDMPGTDERGNFVVRQGTPLKWSRLIFMKSDRFYDCYELAFGDLSLEQYEQDQAFLRRIMDSLAYDASRKQ